MKRKPSERQVVRRHEPIKNRRHFNKYKNLDKDLIADTVHKTVCEVMGTDGTLNCAQYVTAGWGLLNSLGIPVVIQGGAHGIVVDPVSHLCCATTECPGEIKGDYYFWLALPLSGKNFDIIDFSSRHYAAYLERNGFGGRTDGLKFPKYIWQDGDSVRQWAFFEPDQKITEGICAEINDRHPLVVILVITAMKAYDYAMAQR